MLADKTIAPNLDNIQKLRNTINAITNDETVIEQVGAVWVDMGKTTSNGLFAYYPTQQAALAAGARPNMLSAITPGVMLDHGYVDSFIHPNKNPIAVEGATPQQVEQVKAACLDLKQKLGNCLLIGQVIGEQHRREVRP